MKRISDLLLAVGNGLKLILSVIDLLYDKIDHAIVLYGHAVHGYLERCIDQIPGIDQIGFFSIFGNGKEMRKGPAVDIRLDRISSDFFNGQGLDHKIDKRKTGAPEIEFTVIGQDRLTVARPFFGWHFKSQYL